MQICHTRKSHSPSSPPSFKNKAQKLQQLQRQTKGNHERDLLRVFLPLPPLFSSRDGDLLFLWRSACFEEGGDLLLLLLVLLLRWRLQSRFLLLSRSRLPLSSSLPWLAFLVLLLWLLRRLLLLLFLSRSVFPSGFLSGALIS